MKNRAETDEQKEEVMKKLLTIWKLYPNLRLGQLFFIISQEKDLFYIEDYDLVKRGEDFCK